MRKFIKDDLRSVLIIFLLVSVVAIASIGAYSGVLVVDAIKDIAESRAISHLETADFIVIEKTKNIQRFVDVLNANEGLHSLIISDKDDNGEIQSILKKITPEFEDVEGCILTDRFGNEHIYNLPFITEDNLLQLQVSCSRLSEKTGHIKWYNTDQTEMVTSAFSDYVLCGTNIYDDNPVKLYIFVSKDIFSGFFRTIPDKTVVSVLDNSGELIVSSNNEAYNSIFRRGSALMRLYEDEKGFFDMSDSSGNEYVGVHYRSVINDFKFLEIYPRSFFYSESHKITLFMLMIILMLLSVLSGMYIFLNRRYIRPLKRLTHAMNTFDDTSLESRIDVKGNNEVSKLSACFNGMIDRINQIIENIRQKDEAQKKAELMALRSQIKPHFIYNTLNSIKILAVYNKQQSIAKSLQILARLIRNTFSSVETMSPLDKEIEFIRDYIELLQLCYVNKLDVAINIEEEVRGCVIPVMLLQPLVENAVNHGLSVKLAEGAQPAKLCIHASQEDNKLLIEIMDNGIGIEDEVLSKIFVEDSKPMGGGIGLKNIADRIKLLYGEHYGISIKSKEGFFTTVEMRIPLERDDIIDPEQ